MAMHVKKDDMIQVIAGDYKGTTGKVLRVLREENKVIVQGINLKTKHQRQVQSEGKNVNPGIVKLEGSLDISNVMLICPKCKKPTRVNVSREGEKPTRVCKKCSALIDG